MSAPHNRQSGPDRYRIGFLSTVMLGNMNRYRVLRTNVETDPTVDPRWYPLRSWVNDDWLGFLPAWWRVRIRHLLDSFRLFLPARLDAVVVHAPEMWGVYGTFHAVVPPSHPPRRQLRRSSAPHGKDRQPPPTPCRSTGRPLRAVVQLRRRGHPASSRWDAPNRGDQPRSTSRHLVDATAAVRRARRALEILFVGGEPRRKGLDTVLDAFEHHVAGGHQLFVATQSRNLPDELAARLNRNPRVHLHLDLQPDTDELRALFRSADVFVMPTRYDTYGFVLVEALATGIPVIASNVGGIPDIVIDGTTGFLVEPDDPAGLGAAIQRVERMSKRRAGGDDRSRPPPRRATSRCRQERGDAARTRQA